MGSGFELFRVYEITSVSTSEVSGFADPDAALSPLSTSVNITKEGMVSAAAVAVVGIGGSPGAPAFKDVTLVIDGVTIGTKSGLIHGSRDCSAGTISVTATPSPTTGGDYKVAKLHVEGYEKI